MITKRIALLGGLALAAASALVPGQAAAQEKLRITLDTNPSHVRNKGVEVFAEELKKRIGNKLAVEIYPSGQLFRDRDVPKALRQGAVEMAVPGTWQLDGVEPDAGLQTLPMFYGVDGAVVHQILDGKLGDFMNKRLEDRLKVKVIGKWIDLGGQHTFGIDKPINSWDDLKGQKIRHSGGTANAGRLAAMGAVPMLVPFPDVPMAMSQGVINGVATTYESAWTSKLHESGLKYAFEDNQFFGQYIPMVSQQFWSKQPKDVQDAILAAWDVAARGQRDLAAKSQAEARDSLVKAGMKIVKPSAADIAAKRKQLMAVQDDLVKQMKIDAEVVNAAKAGLTAAKVPF
ncbi:TRAP transporter substrate-binding protein DctP [Ramlibacter sp.]|uniref:TRAP transporter substrate-binding protein DctP n=1 Tax=Ramlibacter sp. TaxID=1917967 RepID=UPI002C1BD488|nr:TRAP transporter substrate-binding protein DctP [Ramlibacter sp.]HWI82135.1 TRAP transporter substrate-binding protein DctP [Ramlibacter sp.]